MDTAWIQVFVLTLTQCIAPEGKMVCQEETVEYRFANQEDCASALVQMLDLAARADNVLIDRQQSTCRPAATQTAVFADAESAKAALAGAEGFALIDGEEPPADFIQASHEERLAKLQTCEETGGVAPCKIGRIIVEAAEESRDGEVWRREQ